jgi:hypothetical protein
MRIGGLAIVNFGLVAVWIVIAMGIAREHKKISKDAPVHEPSLVSALAAMAAVTNKRFDHCSRGAVVA